MKHIAILTHEHDQYAETTYTLRGISDQWEASGIKVSVLRGTEKHIDADLAVLHVDLTVIPDEYMEFAGRFPIVLNRNVKDISKRFISNNILSRNDDYDGPVIIKTNLNCGGAAEGLLSQNSLVSKYIRAVRRRLPWTMRAELGMWNYRVLDSVREVPRSLWLNRDLVVEKFLPEKQDDLFVLRAWIFLGDAEENVVMYAKQPIVKSPVAVKIENSREIPNELRQMRRDLGFDFGKFDYGIVNGRVILYDANRTPVSRVTPDRMAAMKLLASGIDTYLKPPFRVAG